MHKLSKTISHTEEVSQVGSNRSLYIDTKKIENVLNEKNIKITKQAHVFKGYASSYNIEILNSFNPELHLKGTESKLGGFKFVTTLVLVL